MKHSLETLVVADGVVGTLLLLPVLTSFGKTLCSYFFSGTNVLQQTLLDPCHGRTSEVLELVFERKPS